MRKLLILTLFAATACAGRTEGNRDDDFDLEATDWGAQLSERLNSNVSGSATTRTAVVGSGGTSTANIEIRGATPGARHPWHVHTGTCASGGPIVGEANDYPVLEIGTDGTDDATAAIEAGMSDEGRYHVNVHRSPTDLTVISCGDLRD